MKSIRKLFGITGSTSNGGGFELEESGKAKRERQKREEITRQQEIKQEQFKKLQKYYEKIKQLMSAVKDLKSTLQSKAEEYSDNIFAPKKFLTAEYIDGFIQMIQEYKDLFVDYKIEETIQKTITDRSNQKHIMTNYIPLSGMYDEKIMRDFLDKEDNYKMFESVFNFAIETLKMEIELGLSKYKTKNVKIEQKENVENKPSVSFFSSEKILKKGYALQEEFALKQKIAEFIKELPATDEEKAELRFNLMFNDVEVGIASINEYIQKNKDDIKVQACLKEELKIENINNPIQRVQFEEYIPPTQRVDRPDPGI